MAKRFNDAMIVIEGASNPLAVSNAIGNAIREINDEQGSVSNCPAVKLMVYQLVHLTGTRDMDDLSKFIAAETVCKERSNG